MIKLIKDKNYRKVIKIIDSARFMAIKLLDIVPSLSKGIRKIKCKDCDYFWRRECQWLTNYKGLPCKKNYWSNIHENLKKKLQNTFNFSNNDINKFTLLLRKGVCLYEYIDNWKKVSWKNITWKGQIWYNHNLESIKHSDNNHPKRIRKKFEMKKLDD